MPQTTTRKIAQFFSSVKLAIALLALIILASIIGTFIPQGLTPSEYIQRYGRQIYRLFFLLGFTDIYHSFWFILLLFLLAANLLLCSLNRIKMRKGVGLIIAHLSILLILSGAIISAVGAERGLMPIYEGQARDSFIMDNQKVKNLDFKIYLEDFILEWYGANRHQVTVSINDPSLEKVFEIKEGLDYPVEGSSYSFRVLRYIPDFYLDINKEVKTRSNEPNNPALWVRITNGRVNEDRWIFSNFPDFSEGKDKNIELAYKWQGNIKDFKSKLKVIEGDKTVLAKVIEVNHPLKYKGYTFYQSTYNPKELNWTGIEVVKDPGVPLVYTGFALLNIGVIIIFYAKPKQNRSF